MFFSLVTPESSNTQSNTTKVKVHLRTGIAEIFDQHQDLMGKVENNLIEIETALENKLEKVLYVLQDAVFIVSTKGLSPEVKQTSVYVYAKDMKEITPAMSLDELSKEYEQKNAELEVETEKLVGQTSEAIRLLINAKMLLLKEDVQFLEKAIQVAKDLKK